MDNAPEAAASTTPARRPGLLKSLYLWVLHWAETPYGTPALFGLSFAESSFFPIPPDVLQIALSVSKPRRSFYYAAVSLVASVLGAILGWYLGYALGPPCRDFLEAHCRWLGFTEKNFDTVEGLYQQYGFLAILVAAFTPLPYKVFTITAGVFGIYLHVLLFASILGRSARFFAVATCIYAFGPAVKDLIEKYFELALVVFAVLLVGGFALITWLF